MTDHCQTLAERFEAKRAAGLVDIKFYINRDAGADAEQIYEEASVLFCAVEDSDLVEDFVFDDKHAVAA